jgi:ATP-dependent Clp protease protease subunit
MDRIDINGSLPSGPRGKFFARSTGTQFAARQTPTAATSTLIELYDEIGYWGVTAKDFRDQLRSTTGDITLRINSPGGDVFDGIAIFNDLVAHKGAVHVEVAGIAASISSIIAMAGTTISIASNAFIMIHNAWTFAYGNRHDLSAAADVLAQIDEAMARTYVGRSKVGIRSVREMMDGETWLGSADAIDKGFADKLLVVEDEEAAVAAAARFDLTNVFAHVPDALRWSGEEAGEAITARDVEKELMRDAGPRSRSQARALMRACKTSPEDATRDAGGEGLTSLLRTLEATNAQLQPAK